jgi:hypothetical protein
MRDHTRLIADVAVVLVIAGVLLSAGCAGSKGTVGPDRTDPATTLADGAKKDADIATEANGIAARSTDAPFVAASAARILDVLRLSPWAKTEATINALVTERDAALAAAKTQGDADAATIAGLRKEIDELKNQALREQARWLTWTGVGLFAAFGVSLIIGQLAAAAKTWPLALLGAGCFGLAQLISHPWFLRSFVGLLVAGVAYSAYYVFDRHREGRLRRSLEKKADVLKQIVPVLDDAYDSAADSLKQALDANIFARFSAVLDRDQKATVHQVRAEVKET